MYLHIGKGCVLEESGIIGIFDLDITSQSKITRDFLNASDKGGEVINASEDIPKSFIVYSEKNQNTKAVYLSQMATSTLFKRNESGLI